MNSARAVGEMCMFSGRRKDDVAMMLEMTGVSVGVRTVGCWANSCGWSASKRIMLLIVFIMMASATDPSETDLQPLICALPHAKQCACTMYWSLEPGAQGNARYRST